MKSAIAGISSGSDPRSRNVTYAPSYDIRRLAFVADGWELMDRITESLLGQFSVEHEIESMGENDRFERFTAFSMIRRHFSRSFEVEDVIVGGGGDTSIDAIAIIVNNTHVTDVDTVNEIAAGTGLLDATFIFIQAERSSSFDASKIGDFGFGVKDFFDSEPKIKRNEKVESAAEVLDAIFKHSAILRRPACILYYVTTGRWIGDNDLTARREAVVGDLTALGIFSSVYFQCAGADELHSAYTQTKNAVARSFDFKNRNDLPPSEGVAQAFIGYVPFSQFRRIISDDSGNEILGSIFYDNVRDWQEYNPVNEKIRQTLDSPERDRFALMNNGVTVIASSIQSLGSKFTISDFQIVNGCQTSNVLFDQRNIIDDTVCVPLRLIETRDEAVKDAIIQATNSQTEVKPEQYFARMKFSRRLEDYFNAMPEEYRIHYERRDGQYDRGAEKKTRIVSSTSVIRAFAGMYLEEPQQTTRGYGRLRERVGKDIFFPEHKLEPYYAASYASFLLENRFKAKTTESKYKVARYHILLAIRLQVDPAKPTFMNSHEMGRRADKLIKALWDNDAADNLFGKAIAVVNLATGENLDRDHVRTIGVTNAILAEFGRAP